MADSRWMQRLERGLGAVAARLHRHPGPVLGVVALLAVGGALTASRLALNTDLVALLPPSFESVQGVRKLEQRFGGLGWMVVVGEGADPEALRRFARDIAPRLEALPTVRFVEYHRANSFFEDRALYYMEPQDLDEVQRRLAERERFERRKRNPLYIYLGDEKPPSLDFSDLEEKYAGQSSQRLAGPGGDYFLDPGTRQIVLLGKPEGMSSSDLTFSAQLVREVEDLLRTVDGKQYGPEFRTGVTGTFKKKADQQKQVARDIVVSSTLALAVLLVYLAFHFRSALAVLLNLAPVVVGLAWTAAVVALTYGRVNLLSGFLGAILGGLGIEHGIHLLTRYFTPCAARGRAG